VQYAPTVTVTVLPALRWSPQTRELTVTRYILFFSGSACAMVVADLWERHATADTCMQRKNIELYTNFWQCTDY